MKSYMWCSLVAAAGLAVAGNAAAQTAESSQRLLHAPASRGQHFGLKAVASVSGQLGLYGFSTTLRVEHAKPRRDE
jgi:hypothetical protein